MFFKKKKPITDINKYFKKVAERVGSMRPAHSTGYGRDVVMKEVARMMIEEPSQTIAEAMLTTLQRVDEWVVGECRNMRDVPKIAGLAMIGKDRVLPESIDPQDGDSVIKATQLFKKHAKAKHFDPYADRNFLGMPKGGALKKQLLAEMYAKRNTPTLMITHQP